MTSLTLSPGLESDGLVDKKSLEEANDISLAIRQAAGSISALSLAKRRGAHP
jgi:hypothetical protein